MTLDLDLSLPKRPDTKIILLRIFPRTNSYAHPDGSPGGDADWRFTTNHRAGELCASLADNKHVFFLDAVNLFSHHKWWSSASTSTGLGRCQSLHDL